MAGGLDAALKTVRAAFAGYPQWTVLDRCPHCGPPIRVAERDLFWLSIKLGNTVGGHEDVKAFLPLLLERLISSNELDVDIVLGKLAREHYSDWPVAERRAVDGYLDAVWRSILSEFPSQMGAFTGVREFLDGIAAAGIDANHFLTVWDTTATVAADRHLAALVSEVMAVRLPGEVLADWVRKDAVRTRLLRAYEHNHAESWSDELALAYDLACLL